MSTEQPELAVAAKIVAAVDRIARGVRAHRQTVAAAAGISVLQSELLRVLARGHPPAYAGSLALELGVSQPTASDSLAALVRKRYVARATNPTDRRRTEFVLTDAGAELATELDRADSVLVAATARLPEPDQERTLRLLLELIGGLLDGGVLAVARTCPTCRFFEESGSGARCALLGTALPVREFRVDCPEHQRGERHQAAR